MIFPLSPALTAIAIPARMPSPFDASAVHPLARRAAEAMLAELEATRSERWRLDDAGGGKMFGVLVVADADGSLGYLRAFSGMLGGDWHVDGWVPPVFDRAGFDAIWSDGEVEMASLAEAIAAPDGRSAERRALIAMLERQAAERAALRDQHSANRTIRRSARVTNDDLQTHHALAQESRRDAAEQRAMERAHSDERSVIESAVDGVDRARVALVATRTARSRDLLQLLQATYDIVNARGEVVSLATLFAPRDVPGGAADCAAPKLLTYAYRNQLRPLALAEVWYGAPPLSGDRRAGVFYPACRSKCGPILAHMLSGVPHDEAPVFGASTISMTEPVVVFEDEWIVIVDKPAGLLSVPGRSATLRDSVQTRMQVRYPQATGPLLVHRLDLDTSGLLLIAKDSATYVALQRLFAQREIVKRYVAWVDGAVAGDAGTIALPLRVDVEDRPRQIHDAVHGRAAVTEWRVQARDGSRTQVTLQPLTGRTHQLRVHCAHPLGLRAPIVGDRLYGDAVGAQSARMLLHAEVLSFVHPVTGVRINVKRPAPF